MRNCSAWYSRVCLCAVLVVALSSLSTTSIAATRYWRNAVGSSDWSIGSNWSTISPTDSTTPGIPIANENVSIANTDGVSRTINDNVTPLTLGWVAIDQTGGTATNTLALSGNNGFTSFALYVGGHNGTSATSGRGALNQSSGSVTVQSASHLYVGYGANSTGNYNLSGNGTINVTSGVEYIGFNGVGVFTQNGGTNNITGTLYLGPNPGSRGTYTLNSGSLAVAGFEYIGNDSTNNLFTQTGGTNTTTFLRVGQNNGSSGTYALGGTGSLTTANFATVGGPGSVGTFTQTGGSFTAKTDLWVGVGGGFGGSGSYTLSGTGSLSVAGTLAIGGSFGNGSFTISGGNANAAAVALGENCPLNVSGGELTANSIVSGAGSAINLSGGSLKTASLDLGGFTNLFNWTGGTFNLSTDVTWDPGAGINSTGSIFGAAKAIGANQTLRITGNENLGGPTGGFGLTLNSGSTHYVRDTLTISLTGTLTQNAGSTLYASSIIQNGGTVNGTLQNQSYFQYNSGTFNGRLLNQGGVNLGTNFVAGDGIRNESGITISTGQTATVNGAGLDNLGFFSLSGGTISGSGPVVNNAGGTLNAYGTINNTFTNNGLLILSSVLRFNGASATNIGIVRGSGTVIGDFANAAGGTIELTSSSPLAITTSTDTSGDGNNDWSNAGVVTLSSSSALGGSQILNTGTVQGVGTVNATVANSGFVRASGGQLILAGAGNTNTAAGTMQAATGSTLMVAQGLATNAGTIGLTGGAFDNNNHAITSSGIISGYGTLRTSSLTNTNKLNVGEGDMDIFGALTNNGTVGIQAGRHAYFFGNVSGAGSFPGTGTANFLASLSPGNSPAAVSFGGNATLESSSALNIELGGTNAGSQFDQLLVSGTLTLGGALNIALINGFSPAAGQVFDILDWGSLSGTFNSINLPTLSGLVWNTSQLYSNGLLSVAAVGVPGDFNNNGTVDAGDYVTWRKYQGTTHVLPNDPTGGTIGTTQYTTWRTHFGQPPGSGSGSTGSAAVPEPTAPILLMFAVASWCLLRSRAA